jgi:hypothetical protein
MERYIKTKFFLSITENSDVQLPILKYEYDQFARLLLAGYAAFTDKAAYHNTLVYTRVELSSLTQVLGKKCSNLSSQSH